MVHGSTYSRKDTTMDPLDILGGTSSVVRRRLMIDRCCCRHMMMMIMMVVGTKSRSIFPQRTLPELEIVVACTSSRQRYGAKEFEIKCSLKQETSCGAEECVCVCYRCCFPLQLSFFSLLLQYFIYQYVVGSVSCGASLTLLHVGFVLTSLCGTVVGHYKDRLQEKIIK